MNQRGPRKAVKARRATKTMLLFLVILLLASPTISFIAFLDNGQESFALVEEMDTEEKEEKKGTENEEEGEKDEKIMEFAELHDSILANIAIRKDIGDHFRYSDINNDVLTPPPEFA